MKKQDLLVSMTINHEFSGKASHCITFFFYLAQCSLFQDDHVIMDKDAKGKGKGKIHTLRVKGRKCSAEEQDVKESTDQPRAGFCRFRQGLFFFA